MASEETPERVIYLSHDCAIRIVNRQFDFEHDAIQPKDSLIRELDQESLIQLCEYEAHVLCASNSQIEMADRIWRTHLSGISWATSEIKDLPHLCPICFKPTGKANPEANCTSRHLALYKSSGLPYCIVEGNELREIDLDVISTIISESENARSLKDQLFSSDEIGDYLSIAASGETWFQYTPTGKNARIHTECCDIDTWGDTVEWIYHEKPEAFVAEVEGVFEQMGNRCLELGLEAAEDHLG